LVSIALALPLTVATLARAQDSAPTGEPIASIDPAELSYDYRVDGSLSEDDAANGVFKSIEAAIDAAPEGTAESPTVIGGQRRNDCLTLGALLLFGLLAWRTLGRRAGLCSVRNDS